MADGSSGSDRRWWNVASYIIGGGVRCLLERFRELTIFQVSLAMDRVYEFLLRCVCRGCPNRSCVDSSRDICGDSSNEKNCWFTSRPKMADRKKITKGKEHLDILGPHPRA